MTGKKRVPNYNQMWQITCLMKSVENHMKSRDQRDKNNYKFNKSMKSIFGTVKAFFGEDHFFEFLVPLDMNPAMKSNEMKNVFCLLTLTWCLFIFAVFHTLSAILTVLAFFLSVQFRVVLCFMVSSDDSVHKTANLTPKTPKFTWIRMHWLTNL